MASKGATGPIGSTGQGFTWQGTFSESITYGFYDVAYYDGSSYISVTISNLGNTPSNATQSWNIMALGSNNATLNVTGTYGAVLVYGEYGWTALGPATAGYVLTTGGTSSLPYWSEPIAGSGSGFGTFSRNFDVVLNNIGSQFKTFGKYRDGDTINSIGMTLEEFIYDVVTEIKAPSIYLTAVPEVIPFGATGDSIVLTFGYTIINAGATAVFGELGFSDDGKVTYTPLFTGTATPNVLVHTISFPEYTSPRYDYKYTVIDSVGGSASAEDFVTIAPYVPPFVTTSVIANTKNTTFGETDYLRQYGNVGSQITLTYSRNSPRIDVKTYSLYYRQGPSGPFDEPPLYGPLAVGNPSSGSETDDHTTSLPISNPSLAQTTNNIDYYHEVRDEYDNDTTNSTPVRVTFEPLYFYGSTSSIPTTKSQLLTLPNVKLASVAGTNQFTFLSGTIYDKYIVAIPSNKTLSEAKDMTQTGNPDLTSSFVLQSPEVSVLDFGNNNAYNYKVYAYTPTIGYTIDVTIRIKLT
jgi:hypothetical protein